ncbi:FHA domain-containing protein [bacterium]|nr:FHA domain-containing protein [bacterium]
MTDPSFADTDFIATAPKVDVAPCDATRAIQLRELAERSAGLSREDFRLRYRSPFLLQLNDTGTLPSSRVTTASGRFQTAAALAASPAPLHAYELTKRPGANVFSLMVTLGRAPNNDIIVAHPAVSKFHASFAQTGDEWTVTDSSSNGTWVDGEKLAPKTARALRIPTCLSFARAVIMMLLSADAVYDELERLRGH